MNATHMHHGSKNNRLLWGLLVVGVVVLIVAGIAKKQFRYRSTQVQPEKDLYQVVLLDNDQAFFGKLHIKDGRHPYLTEVYYLQPQAQEVDQNGILLNGGERKFTVTKRGEEEIHQPTDTLYLNPEHILYWENVGADSLVAKGIEAKKKLIESMTESAPEEAEEAMSEAK